MSLSRTDDTRLVTAGREQIHTIAITDFMLFFNCLFWFRHETEPLPQVLQELLDGRQQPIAIRLP